MGKVAGAHDYLCIPDPTYGLPAFFIEFKSAAGKLGDKQIAFGNWLEELRIPWHLVRSADEARGVLSMKGIL